MSNGSRYLPVVAEAIVEGRAFVVRSVNQEMRTIAKPDIVGKPLPETYNEPGYAPILGLLEMVRVTGCPMALLFTTPYGLTGWVALRLVEPGRVSIRFRRVPSHVRGARAALQTAASGLVVAATTLGQLAG